MVGKGAPLGKPQAGGGPRAVAADGRKSIPAVTRLEPEEHRKAHRAAAAAGLSLSGYLAELVRRDVLDENDCPRWAQQESGANPCLHWTYHPAQPPDHRQTSTDEGRPIS